MNAFKSHDRSFFTILHLDGTSIEHSEITVDGVAEFLASYPNTAAEVEAVFEFNPAEGWSHSVTEDVFRQARSKLLEAISGVDKGWDATLSWAISAMNVALGEASLLEEQAIKQSRRRIGA